MNELIENFAFKAGCNQHKQSIPINNEVNGWIISHENLEKFAQLIVKECARIAKNDEYDDDERHCCTDARNQVAKTIREKFGVK
jgi:hypothetical protein